MVSPMSHDAVPAHRVTGEEDVVGIDREPGDPAAD